MKERLQQVFINPKVQAAVVDHVIHSKPLGWKRRSNAPYYKERYAAELKEVVDAMIKDRRDRFYPYEMAKKTLGIEKGTLFLRIYQAHRYLLDYMDTPDKLYAKFFETVTIQRRRGTGVVIAFAPGFAEGNGKLEPLPADSKNTTWRDKMEDWVENSQPGDEPFFQDKLVLSPDEISDLKATFIGIPGIISSITSSHVKLVKINV